MHHMKIILRERIENRLNIHLERSKKLRHLKSLVFSSRCYYQILHSMLFIQEIEKIVIKIIFRWCLNMYYSIILSRCYYKSSKDYLPNHSRVVKQSLNYDEKTSKDGGNQCSNRNGPETVKNRFFFWEKRKKEKWKSSKLQL